MPVAPTDDILWHNRSFNISVGSLGGGTLNQQHVVALLPTLNQASTGQCVEQQLLGNRRAR